MKNDQGTDEKPGKCRYKQHSHPFIPVPDCFVHHEKISPQK
jgi:hypothetical protein